MNEAEEYTHSCGLHKPLHQIVSLYLRLYFVFQITVILERFESSLLS